MFLDNLSSSILRICGEKHFSYEFASEKCNISNRYFGSIVRRQSVPSITVLEKICVGLGESPNNLLGVQTSTEEFSYRLPMLVREDRFYGGERYHVCPRCKTAFERDYQNYCDRCGQMLAWELLKDEAEQGL